MDAQPHSLTLSQLSDRSGVKARTLQFWTSNGVLKADAATSLKGTGVHRRWPQLEVEIAAVLGVLERYGVTVGTLHGIAASVREWRRIAVETFGLKSRDQVLDYLRGLPEEEGAFDIDSEERANRDCIVNWQRWQDAKSKNGKVFLRIAVSSDSTWIMNLVLGDEGFRLDWGDENSYFVVKLSNILRGI